MWCVEQSLAHASQRRRFQRRLEPMPERQRRALYRRSGMDPVFLLFPRTHRLTWNALRAAHSDRRRDWSAIQTMCLAVWRRVTKPSTLSRSVGLRPARSGCWVLFTSKPNMNHQRFAHSCARRNLPELVFFLLAPVPRFSPGGAAPARSLVGCQTLAALQSPSPLVGFEGIRI